jgi:hypothetical protein
MVGREREAAVDMIPDRQKERSVAVFHQAFQGAFVKVMPETFQRVPSHPVAVYQRAHDPDAYLFVSDEVDVDGGFSVEFREHNMAPAFVVSGLEPFVPDKVLPQAFVIVVHARAHGYENACHGLSPSDLFMVPFPGTSPIRGCQPDPDPIPYPGSRIACSWHGHPNTPHLW